LIITFKFLAHFIYSLFCESTKWCGYFFSVWW